MSVCLSVRSHISKTTRPNFTTFFITCDHGSVLLWQQCNTLVLPVRWVMSCFYIMERIGQYLSKTRMFSPVRQMAAPGRSLPSPTASCFMPSPPDTVGEGIMFSGSRLPRSFVRTDLVIMISHERLEQSTRDLQGITVSPYRWCS